MNDLTHIDGAGRPRMVDVGEKGETLRSATAEGALRAGRDVMAALREGRTPKGNVLETARLAGVLAAKRTSELIPLCHPLLLTHVAVDFDLGDDHVTIRACAKAHGRTGVEMEALTAVAIAGLTLYDMLKALSKTMRLDDVRLIAKSGGASGDFRAEGRGVEP